MLTIHTYWTPEKIAEREAWREHIAAHVDAGTCHICELPVADFAPKHGPTGAHWECHSGPIVEAEQQSRATNQDQALNKPDMHPRFARANGGSLVHLVIPATGTSLCGHRPKNTAHHMKRRGKWLVWKDDSTVPAHMTKCAKCLAKAQVMYPPAEDKPD